MNVIEKKDPVFVGVFGDPVGHSLSPAMHNAAFRALKLPYCYVKWRVPIAGLRDALKTAQALDFRGVNLTIPLKERAAGIVDSLTPQAKRTRAVNTVTFDRGRMQGHNTDGEGFLRSLKLELGFVPRKARAVMLGAGGAARAVAFALADAGASEILILNRTPSRARALARDIRAACRPRALARDVRSACHTRAQARAVGSACRTRARGQGFPRGDGWHKALAGASLLVNASSLGMRGEKCPVPAAAFPARLRVADLVYNPPLTDLVRSARRRRLRAMNGVGMLVHQGALAFTRWTGRRAPVGVMRRALLLALPG